MDFRLCFGVSATVVPHVQAAAAEVQSWFRLFHKLKYCTVLYCSRYLAPRDTINIIQAPDAGAWAPPVLRGECEEVFVCLN